MIHYQTKTTPSRNLMKKLKLLNGYLNWAFRGSEMLGGGPFGPPYVTFQI